MSGKLKESFYKVVEGILSKEFHVTNIGVNKDFNLFVDHLEKAMTHPRIIEQFKLSCERYQEERGVFTENHFNWIKEDIKSRVPNY